MKILSIAFGISAAIGTILCLVFWELTSDVRAAAGVAGVPVAAFPQIAAMLEQWEAKKSLRGQKMMIRTFEGFSIFWPIMVAAGTIILIALSQLGVFFGTVLAAMLRDAANRAAHVVEPTQVMDETTVAAVGLINIPIQFIGGYLFGTWMGTRCARNGIGAIVLAAALGAIGTAIINFMLVSAENWRAMLGHEANVSFFIWQILDFFGLWATSGLLGFWRGRKQRFSKYMLYLLSVLPPDTQSVLMDLAFDEAKKRVNTT